MGKIGLIILGIVVVVALAIGGWAIGGYNTLVAKRNTVDQAWSQVENNLTRRADLIGNLVGTVKGIAGQEKEVFGKIADARARLLSAGTPEEKIVANDALTKATQESGLLPGSGILGPGGRFLSITEQYPVLKSSENFLRLQDELAGQKTGSQSRGRTTTTQRLTTIQLARNFQPSSLPG